MFVFFCVFVCLFVFFMLSRTQMYITAAREESAALDVSRKPSLDESKRLPTIPQNMQEYVALHFYTSAVQIR